MTSSSHCLRHRILREISHRLCQHLKNIRSCSGITRSFLVIYAVVQVDKTGDLIVDHTQFPDDFLDTAESMERRSFYERCLGLHSASSEPSKAVIIHFHGGGFLAQTSQSHVSYLSHWANQLNVPVVSVDYMTAPEHPYPRAVNDCSTRTPGC
ncbi:uncharacterized protein LOC135829544 [Sycon ciliatum]|uniref:uncharacterized protein LOC135829544 n=1 Tax=Sycon ciliatum TaxID=27933 RepID=UPI0031F62CAB